MFSGIIESTSQILQVHPVTSDLVRMTIEKPAIFTDLKVGDSIAVNGICLTLESNNESTMQFALAAETLRILQMKVDELQKYVGKKLNLERSLRFGDRIHGHLVSGHVDSMGRVVRAELSQENFFLDVEVSPRVLPYLWEKGSITINGVSLTINQINKNVISVCLIPETRSRTNLGDLSVGEEVTIEADYFAKGLHHFLRNQNVKNYGEIFEN